MLGIFLDIETTGLDFFRHRAIDFAFKIVDLSSGTVRSSYQSVVKQTKITWDKRDPKSVEFNGFSWEKVQTGKEESQIKFEIIDQFHQSEISRKNAVYICQNPAFDRCFFSQIIDPYTQESLNWPYHWLDFASMYWAIRVDRLRRGIEAIPDELSFSKNAIAEYFHIPKETSPHCALNGVNHLIECYQKVLGFLND